MKKLYPLTLEDRLNIRKLGIGGSDIGAICGVSPYSTPVSVFLQKTGQTDDIEQNEKMYWGNVLESVVAEEFSKRNNLKIRKNNAVLVHHECDYFLANIDREIVGKYAAILECKTSGTHMQKQWESGEIPPPYILQCQWYMMITGHKKAYLAVLCGGQKYFQFEILRDDELIQHITKIAHVFWGYVASKTPPPLDTCNSAEIMALYPQSEDITVVLPESAQEIIDRYKQLSATIQELEIQHELCKSQLQALMADAERGTCNNYLVTWKTTHTERVDINRLKKEHTDICKNYIKTTSTRRFTLKEFAHDDI